jgi:hypothetical protein
VFRPVTPISNFYNLFRFLTWEYSNQVRVKKAKPDCIMKYVWAYRRGLKVGHADFPEEAPCSSPQNCRILSYIPSLQLPHSRSLHGQITSEQVLVEQKQKFVLLWCWPAGMAWRYGARTSLKEVPRLSPQTAALFPIPLPPTFPRPKSAWSNNTWPGAIEQEQKLWCYFECQFLSYKHFYKVCRWIQNLTVDFPVFGVCGQL